jgi:hypothetical protein
MSPSNKPSLSSKVHFNVENHVTFNPFGAHRYPLFFIKEFKRRTIISHLFSNSISPEGCFGIEINLQCFLNSLWYSDTEFMCPF